jgi:N-acyl-D-amino-acid deacylase
MKVNWLFKNVTVIDGSGGPQYRGDVAVKGDRIVDIAPALNLPAEQVIDGQGRVLAPGLSMCIPMTISTSFVCRPICPS